MSTGTIAKHLAGELRKRFKAAGIAASIRSSSYSGGSSIDIRSASGGALPENQMNEAEFIVRDVQPHDSPGVVYSTKVYRGSVRNVTLHVTERF